MQPIPTGAVAVIFVSERNDADPAGYDAASDQMAAEAARQPGYLGAEAVRDAAGTGITVSYWADHAAAEAWRDHAGHTAIRNRGRADWYDGYHLLVCDVARSYRWER
jgi:heme-degrading monooxygenase HmoA